MRLNLLAATAAAVAIASPAMAFESPQALAKAYVAAVAAEDLEGVKAVYADQVDSFLTRGGVATSPDVIAAEWAKLFAGFDNIVMHTHEIGSVEGPAMRSSWGDWGMTATPAAGGEPVEWVGTFMDVAIKTGKGWKYRADLAPMKMVAKAAPTAP